MTGEPRALTQLLQAWTSGDEGAVERLIPAVYGELRVLARAHLRRERPGHTLQTSDLVNEAYIRLVGQKRTHWQTRSHFFGVTAQIMRRILVDRARARGADKRGGDAPPLEPFDDRVVAAPETLAAVDELSEALNDLEQVDARQSQIVTLRFFGGLTHEEIAAALEVSVPTVEREWRAARLWLRQRLALSTNPPHGPRQA